MSNIKGFHGEVIEASQRHESYPNKLTEIKNTVNTSPFNPGGASFKTHKLVQISSSKLAYQPSIFGIVFCSLFIFIGIGLLSYNIFSIVKSETFSLKEFTTITSIVGIIFTVVGSVFLFTMMTPRVFDKSINLYHKSFKSPLKNARNSEKINRLSDIVAIQIIGEHINSSDNPYKSFELNLVFNDTRRKNVIDHGNLKAVVNDAEVLSQFLNVPIWHATSHVGT